METSDTMIPLRAAKQNLRKSIREALRQLPETEVQFQSHQVHEKLFALPEFRAARNISVFLSMPAGEISTRPIVKYALEQGKKVFVPYLCKTPSASDRSLMDMVSLQSLSDYESLKPDKWGIPTPDASSVGARARCLCESFTSTQPADEGAKEGLEDLDLIVMPGVAFDVHCNRLGHGKGFYDIFLAQYQERREGSKPPYLVAIALDQQVLADTQQVPVDSSDWKVDAVLSGKQTVP